jgi:mannonate dehydratase
LRRIADLASLYQVRMGGAQPGHGVDIDERIAARFPYKPAYLPVARLADGTMWNW